MDRKSWIMNDILLHWILNRLLTLVWILVLLVPQKSKKSWLMTVAGGLFTRNVINVYNKLWYKVLSFFFFFETRFVLLGYFFPFRSSVVRNNLCWHTCYHAFCCTANVVFIFKFLNSQLYKQVNFNRSKVNWMFKMTEVAKNCK